MIARLCIQDSPAFTKVDLGFHQGLNVITGASGSGKSVFFHSLLALFGMKESNAAELQADFALHQGPKQIRISKKDKTRYVMDGQNSSKKKLQQSLAYYVKFLNHKDSSELESESLLSLLDEWIDHDGHKKMVQDYKDKFIFWEEKKRELETLKKEEKNLAQLKEITLFEIEKIQSIQPKVGEYEDLLKLKKQLSKRDKLQSLGFQAQEAVAGLSSISIFLEAAELELEGFASLRLELESLIASELQRLESLELQDPELILERLSKLSWIHSRYGGETEALQHLEEQKRKFESFENLGDRLVALAVEITQLEEKLRVLAQQISKVRQTFLPSFLANLNAYASMLLLGELRLENLEGNLSQDGIDILQLKVGNSGVETLSSGETNRLRLAVLALGSRTGILLLDEIDANLSGEESEGVAKLLKKLSSSYQVFAISHQPHLPAFADRHFVVQKGEKWSQMMELDQEGRVLEIARMISGSTLSQEALNFARKKLELS